MKLPKLLYLLYETKMENPVTSFMLNTGAYSVGFYVWNLTLAYDLCMQIRSL